MIHGYQRDRIAEKITYNRNKIVTSMARWVTLNSLNMQLHPPYLTSLTFASTTRACKQFPSSNLPRPLFIAIGTIVSTVALRTNMEQENSQSLSSTMPIIERLDRLDHLLSAMEAKQNKSQRYSCSPESVESKLDDDKRHKPLSSALQEVQFKGTLMERVAMLENRVLQLSLEMEEDYLSRSSSSTARLQENIKQGVPAKQDNDVRTLEKQDQVTYQEKIINESHTVEQQNNVKGKKGKETRSIPYTRKWLRCFQIGC